MTVAITLKKNAVLCANVENISHNTCFISIRNSLVMSTEFLGSFRIATGLFCEVEVKVVNLLKSSKTNEVTFSKKADLINANIW
jgi:hypothetical protein